MSAFQIETKAVVHLNNVGVELLIRGCHRQAIETFHDAVKIAQLSSNIARPLPHDGKSSALAAPGTLKDHERMLKIEEMLHKSEKRLAKPDLTQGVTFNAMNLTVVSDDQDPLLIASDAHSSTITYLIRIVSIENESSSSDDFASKAAIMLYNYGVSYLALQSSVPTSHTEIQLGALRMFRLSFTTVIHIECERNIAEGMSWSQCTRLTLILVLGQLIRATCLLDLSNESEQYMVQLDYFINALQGLHNTKEKVTMQHACAA